MVYSKKKKYTEGAAVKYISRRHALKKLQLSLRDFRRLCIAKGIYPREPNNRKQAQKGKGGVQILYATSDINFLAADPLMFEVRKIKTRKLGLARAKGMRQFDLWGRLQKKNITLNYDHLVKERYPAFIDALRDLDDCLCLLFLFATFPTARGFSPRIPQLARKLTLEFLHLVIEARALRKVFVSIKGYYYQVELRGETITWCVPHAFGDAPDKRRSVDLHTMSYFADFYVVLLGFVNFRLYQQHNLVYPPRLGQLQGDASENDLVHRESLYFERMSCLNVGLVKTRIRIEEDEECQLDSFAADDDDDADDLLQIQKEAEKAAKVKKLFEGVKVFVNREVPREPLVICIRACGGEISWEKTLSVGSTFDEDDETITHHIVDRPSMDKQYISRYYVQPQWVFDSVNAAKLLPVEKYLMGAVLPPHLSPFPNPLGDRAYKPPEELEQLDDLGVKYTTETTADSDENSSDNESEISDNDNMEVKVDDNVSAEDHNKNDEVENQEDDVPVEEQERLAKMKKMGVKKGALYKTDAFASEKEKIAEKKLMEKMIRKKHRFLYKRMKDQDRKHLHRVYVLTKKRQQLDNEVVSKCKEEKRQRRKNAAFLEA